MDVLASKNDTNWRRRQPKLFIRIFFSSNIKGQQRRNFPSNKKRKRWNRISSISTSQQTHKTCLYNYSSSPVIIPSFKKSTVGNGRVAPTLGFVCMLLLWLLFFLSPLYPGKNPLPFDSTTCQILVSHHFLVLSPIQHVLIEWINKVHDMYAAILLSSISFVGGDKEKNPPEWLTPPMSRIAFYQSIDTRYAPLYTYASLFPKMTGFQHNSVEKKKKKKKNFSMKAQWPPSAILHEYEKEQHRTVGQASTM